MYRLRFATYYNNHPEYHDISKIKDSSNHQNAPIRPIINLNKSASTCNDNSKEFRTIMFSIETNLEEALLNLKRSASYLQYV